MKDVTDLFKLMDADGSGELDIIEFREVGTCAPCGATSSTTRMMRCHVFRQADTAEPCHQSSE